MDDCTADVYDHLQSPTIAKMILGQFASAAEVHWWRDLAPVCRQWRDIIAEFASRPDLLTPAQLFYDADAMSRHSFKSQPQYLLLAPQGFMPAYYKLDDQSKYEHQKTDADSSHIGIVDVPHTNNDADNDSSAAVILIHEETPAPTRRIIKAPMRPIGWQGRKALKGILSRLSVKLSLKQRYYLGHLYMFNGDLATARAIIPWTAGKAICHHIDMGCAGIVTDSSTYLFNGYSKMVLDRHSELSTYRRKMNHEGACADAPKLSQVLLLHLYIHAISTANVGAAIDLVAEMRIHAFNLALNYTIPRVCSQNNRFQFLIIFAGANKQRCRYNPAGDCADAERDKYLAENEFDKILAGMQQVSVATAVQIEFSDGSATKISSDDTWLGNGLHDPSTCGYCPRLCCA